MASLCVYSEGVFFNFPFHVSGIIPISSYNMGNLSPALSLLTRINTYFSKPSVKKKNTESTLQLKNIFNLINTFVLLLSHYVTCEMYQLSPVASTVLLYRIILDFNVSPAC